MGVRDENPALDGQNRAEKQSEISVVLDVASSESQS